MSEWIRIETALPTFNKHVLFCTEGQLIHIGFRREEEEYNEHWTVPQIEDRPFVSGPVVAWMDIPEFPEPFERL